MSAKNNNPFDFNDVTSKALLLVEGIDDAKFFDAFLKDGLNAYNIQVVQVRSKDNFRLFLTVTLKNAENFAGLRRLGIVRDADTSAADALKSLQDSLRDAAMPAPEQPWETARTENLNVSIALMPDGTSNGNLEELCLRALDDASLECIDSYIECVNSIGGTIADNSLAKAKVFAYLATGPVPRFRTGRVNESTRRRAPGLRLGDAAEARVWDWTSPAFAQMRQFLSDLAGD